MKTKLSILIFLCILSFENLSAAKDSLQLSQEQEIAYQIAIQAYLDSLDQTLNYETGKIVLKNEIATIDVPPGFKYLNGKDSEMILIDIWGNPPSEEGGKSLGMLIPENLSPLGDSIYSINITYSAEGYIDDKDAKDIDYDDLLSTMKSDLESSNEFRVENGYPAIHLVGWASPPYYDSENKKLHWAKEAKFEGSTSNTLNYSVRILGRKGFLELNAIGEMYVFDDVNKSIPQILTSVNFNDGHKYADFDPDIDKIAAYGIGGLIAGKVLLKAGILAKIGLVLAKFWKIIVFGFIALFAGLKKLFGKDDEVEQAPEA